MNNFVNSHPYATGIGLHAMIDFNFRDLEMTLKRHPRSKVMTHFTKSTMVNIFKAMPSVASPLSDSACLLLSLSSVTKRFCVYSA